MSPSDTVGKDRCRSENLARLLRPRRIVFIGGEILQRSIAACARIGFEGEIWVVNPKRDEIAGRPCFKSLSDLPGVPDAAFVAVRKETSVEVVRELADMGVGGAVCYAAGFAEIDPGGDAAGAALQDALVEAAGEMALVGPNCYGVLNYLDGAALWPDLQGGERVESGVAIISQSGNISLNFTMTDRSVPLAQVISVGNQAALGVGDYIPALVDDSRIKAIGLYIEGLDDVAAFSRAAAYALEKGVPLVALKVGKSEVGSRIALTHTSSLAGSDQLYAALFDRLGIVRAHSLGGFMEQLKFFAVAGPLENNQLTVLTCSGGDAAMVADLAEAQGLAFPALLESQRQKLSEILPNFATLANPLDYNTSIWGKEKELHGCFAAAMSGDHAVTILVMDYPRPGLQANEDYDAGVRAMIRAAADTGRLGAVVATFPELLPEEARARLVAAGLVPLQGMDEAIAAIGGAAWYARQRAEKKTHAGNLVLPGAVLALQDAVMIDEWHSKQHLKDAGVAVPDGRRVTAGEAAAAARDLGFPLVVKGIGADLAHKSDKGGVVLGLTNEESVVRAVAGMTGIAETFLIERMIPGTVAELLVGVKHDPSFGYALTIGAGGVLVEVLEDAATLLLPLTRTEVERALAGLKVGKLLKGYRGRPAGDIPALVDSVLGIAALVQKLDGKLVELDVNPLMILPEGQGCVAADALIYVEGTA